MFTYSYIYIYVCVHMRVYFTQSCDALILKPCTNAPMKTCFECFLSTGKAVFSAAKSVAQGSLDKNLLSNLATIGRSPLPPPLPLPPPHIPFTLAHPFTLVRTFFSKL